MKISFYLLKDESYDIVFEKNKSDIKLCYHLLDQGTNRLFITDLEDNHTLNTYSYDIPSPYQKYVNEFKFIHSKLDISLLKTAVLMCDDNFVDFELDGIEMYYK